MFYKMIQIKRKSQILSLFVIYSGLSACQSQPLQLGQTGNPFQYERMLSKAEACIAQKNNSSQCYQQAFPRRCNNFAKDMHLKQNSIQNKLINCVSACQQAPIASRSFGACSVIL
jgi:hypothetical protein